MQPGWGSDRTWKNPVEFVTFNRRDTACLWAASSFRPSSDDEESTDPHDGLMLQCGDTFEQWRGGDLRNSAIDDDDRSPFCRQHHTKNYTILE